MEWYQAVIVFAVAFAVAYCMVPVSKKIAFRIGAIDYPGYRRMNREPIPRCGGIALYVGLIAACFTMFLGVRFFDWDLHDLYILSDVNYIVLFIGVTTMFTVGLVDDITQLSPGVKLAGQIVAATVVTLSGITIGAVRTLVVGDYLSLGWIDYPLTVLYLVVFVNITNLIDGLDGLASGLVAIVAGGLLYLVLMRGSFTLVPLIIAGVPVLDTVSAIVRRKRLHQPVKDADLGHIHHRLMRAGLSQKRSVAVLWLCSAALVLVGCLMGNFSGPVRWMVCIVLAVVLFFVIWKFGLFKPVLKHHYDNRGKRGPRVPRQR